jgi:hypothetical protein
MFSKSAHTKKLRDSKEAVKKFSKGAQDARIQKNFETD